MSVDIFPSGITSPGNNTFLWTATKPALLADLTGAGAFDVTCYLQADGVEIDFDQAREDDTRGCDSSTRESFGATTFTKDEIAHIVDPQGAGTVAGNMALGEIEADALQYCSIRMGIPHGTVPTATHKWDIYAVQTGEAHISPLAAGKYLRRVKTSWTRVAQGVVIPAA